MIRWARSFDGGEGGALEAGASRRRPMYQLKPLSRDGIPAALRKAERYRLLNDPWEAESICRDVLAIDGENQEALIILILALTDQFAAEGCEMETARALLPRLQGEYRRAYYE